MLHNDSSATELMPILAYHNASVAALLPRFVAAGSKLQASSKSRNYDVLGQSNTVSVNVLYSQCRGAALPWNGTGTALRVHHPLLNFALCVVCTRL